MLSEDFFLRNNRLFKVGIFYYVVLLVSETFLVVLVYNNIYLLNEQKRLQFAVRPITENS